ncbi:MAG TPA: SAM-dependent chlorinase/fluorinase [Vicinamibacteria bacterium]|nr:SAM-dependent chlorinase/fluorinase [Vicinamibacteria bacterium]
MPVIALLTDFGLQDHYVGAMKGAILTVCPQATLVDVLHEVPRHDVAAGALALDASFRFFPPGTVFLAVVDPGVGSERRALGFAAGGWLFVGPDNGLFTHVLEAHPAARVHLLANPALQRRPLSLVFHGRDLFGPAAAHLACGFPLDEVGPRVEDPVRLPLPPRLHTEGACEGTVLATDHFGNVITSVTQADLRQLTAETAGELEVRLGGQDMPLVSTYSDVAPGEACAVVGSSGRVEVAVNRGRGDRLPGAVPGARVVVRRCR